MRYVSLFSGIEAATVAWDRLGWQPLAFAEVDEFPAAVLAHRFPDIPNLGDVCKIDWEEFYEKHGAIDVLIGGSPCQSFSIAGNREGLEGESRLMYEYVRAVRDLVRASGGGSPRYIVWENVPGCLSSNKGRDFGCLLDELEECGYFVAWRTLDSQFARVFDRASGRFRGPVPQRRRRVYLVGSLGGPSAAEILFERQSLRGDYPKGRDARETLARDSTECAGMGDSAGFKYHQGSAAGGGATMNCRSLSTRSTGTPSPSPRTSAARSDWRAFDGSHVGALSSNPAQTKGQGQSLIMTQFGEVAGTLLARADSSPNVDGGANVVCMQDGQAKGAVEDDLSPTLNASHEQPIAVCFGDCGLRNGSNECDYAKYSAEHGSAIYEYVCCSCGHRFMSGDGPVDTEMDEDWYRIRCPKCGSGRYADASKVKVICAADDTANAAVDEDLCGSLKVGGGVALNSNGEMVVGALCARDYKGVSSQFFQEGKVIFTKEA